MLRPPPRYALRRTTFALACLPQARSRARERRSGADDQDRTGDLVLTKDALCQLSYIGLQHQHSGTFRLRAGLPGRSSRFGIDSRERRLERETGIEPATNSLEGCDSTTELLPPRRHPMRYPLRHFGETARPRQRTLSTLCASHSPAPTSTTRFRVVETDTGATKLGLLARSSRRRARPRAAEVGGEGRVRTSVATRAADLQSAAIDRSATSPNLCHLR